MSIKPVIVAVGYNRINSMSRLLQALENAVYDEEVTLIISIDYGDNQNLIENVNQFVWSHGEKIVKIHSKKLGLRKHVMECMDYSIEYGAAIIFEDDTMPAPYFYSYAKQAVNFYAQEERVFAISLYSQLWNGYANREFVPLKKNHDAYISQIECSWGECFIGERWKDFKNWYIRNEGKLKDSKKIPFAVCTWKESYSKYLLYYIVENNKFYVTPYDSLSTNFNNAGTHISVGTSTYQVPLLQGEKKWNFPTFEEAVSYDAFFENVSIKALIEQRYTGKQVCIDYYGLHIDYENYDLCLTTKKLNRKIIQRYGLELRPPELNYIYNISGDDLYLYDLSTEKKNHLSRKHHYNMLRYDVKELHWIDSLFYTLYTWWLRIKK